MEVEIYAWERFEDTWKLEKRNVLHVLNVARSHKSDRYDRSSIYRSLNVRISCVISIVQNSVNIQNTTWLGKRMLEQCTYDNTKHLQFSKTLYIFQFIFHFHSTVISNILHSKSFIYCCSYIRVLYTFQKP